MTRWGLWIVPALLIAAGCGSEQAMPLGPYEAPLDETPRMIVQAEAALDRYDKAVREAGGAPRFVPVGPVTEQIGDWEPALAGNAKAAFVSGHLLPTGTMPAAPADKGEVTWQNGDRETVGLLSAEKAVSRRVLAGRAACTDCVPLEITGARFGTMRVTTTRGIATAPAWEFTVKGSAVRVRFLATDGAGTVRVTPPTWDPNNPPAGLAVDSASGAAGSRQLEVSFIGAPQPASEPCGADYTAKAVESTAAVVVYLVTTRHPMTGEQQACTAVGMTRTATAELAAPLGERAVLEVTQGLPVAVTLTS